MIGAWILIVFLKTSSGAAIEHIPIGTKAECDAAVERVAMFGGVTAVCVKGAIQ